MQESRMMAEVAPPGVCAMPKVSGNRIATPFAPPRPGSTPMITPSTMPVSISTRFIGVSATLKPCISEWISSIALAQAQQSLERTLGQRDQEPALEDEEHQHHHADADRAHLPPRVLAEPAHEEGDEQRSRDVEADPAHQRDEHRGGHQHRQHELQLAALDER